MSGTLRDVASLAVNEKYHQTKDVNMIHTKMKAIYLKKKEKNAFSNKY